MSRFDWWEGSAQEASGPTLPPEPEPTVEPQSGYGQQNKVPANAKSPEVGKVRRAVNWARGLSMGVGGETEAASVAWGAGHVMALVAGARHEQLLASELQMCASALDYVCAAPLPALRARLHRLAHGTPLAAHLHPLQEDESDDDEEELLPSVEELLSREGGMTARRVRDERQQLSFSSVEEYTRVRAQQLRDDYLLPARRALSTIPAAATATKAGAASAPPRVPYELHDDIRLWRDCALEAVSEGGTGVGTCAGVVLDLRYRARRAGCVDEAVPPLPATRPLMTGALLLLCGEGVGPGAGVPVRVLEWRAAEWRCVVQASAHLNRRHLHRPLLALETAVLYEPYHLALTALRRLRRAPDLMPLQPQLLRMEDVCQPPAYLELGTVYRLRDALGRNGGEVNAQAWARGEEESKADCWGGLSAEQGQGVRVALGRRLGVVAGAPGTGKSHVLVAALRTLSASLSLVEAPVLVVCGANRALDRVGVALLSGADGFPWLVRLGAGGEGAVAARALHLLRRQHARQPLYRAAASMRHRHALLLARALQHHDTLEDADENWDKVTKCDCGEESSCGACGDCDEPLLDQGEENAEGCWWRAVRRCARLAEELRALGDWGVVRGARLVLGTAAGCARHHQLLRLLGPPAALLDEAAELDEGSVAAALPPSLRHLALLGDPHQLGPRHPAPPSLLARLLRHPAPHHQLTEQRRLQPYLLPLLVPHVYPTLTAPRVTAAQVAPLAPVPSLFLHTHRESAGTGYVMEMEAAWAAALCAWAVHCGAEQGWAGVALVCPYAAVLRRARALLDERWARWAGGVHCSTVDAFQGGEARVVVSALGEAGGSAGGAGFLSEGRRGVVLLSRGSHALLLACSERVLGALPAWPWAGATAALRARQALGATMPLGPAPAPQLLLQHVEGWVRARLYGDIS